MEASADDVSPMRHPLSPRWEGRVFTNPVSGERIEVLEVGEDDGESLHQRTPDRRGRRHGAAPAGTVFSFDMAGPRGKASGQRTREDRPSGDAR